MDDLSGLDDTDRLMVRELQADGRLSVNALAERANVSRATAYGRFNRLCDSGVIRGFSAVIDPARVGLPIAAVILVNIEQNSWRRCATNSAELPGLEYLAFTSGGLRHGAPGTGARCGRPARRGARPAARLPARALDPDHLRARR